MFKVLTIGDPHFKVGNFKETGLLLSNTLKAIEEKKPDLVVVLGDILDRHELIHQGPLKRITEFLDQLCQRKPTILLVGNHDRPNNTVFLTDDHPFHAFRKWKNFTVVDKPIMREFEGMTFTFAPFVEPGRFVEALNTMEAKWEGSTAIFAHQEIRGVKIGAFHSTKGDAWLSNYPLLISGHIHEYSKTKNVIYVGTPFQQAFDESPDKAISLFSFTEKGYTEERIKVSGAPKITVKVKALEVAGFDLSKYGDSKLKLIIIGSAEELKGVKKSREVKKLTESGVKVEYDEEVLIDTSFEFKEPTRTDGTSRFIGILESLVKQEKDPALLEAFQQVYGLKTKKASKFKLLST